MSLAPSALAFNSDRHDLLRGLFVCPVGVGLADPREDAPEVPEEREAIAHAHPPRRRAFRAGRHAARRALATFGTARAVPRGAGGAPIWPAGLTGSISHSRTACAAVVARHRDAAAIGLDVEEAKPLDPALWDAVCTPRECAALGRAGAAGLVAKQLFCAKEALYKAQFPISGRMLEFRDIDISIDAAGTAFTARFLTAAPPFASGATLPGRLALADGLIWAAVTIPAGGIDR